MTRKLCAVLTVMTSSFLFFSCDNFAFNLTFDSGFANGNGISFGDVPQNIKERVVYYAMRYAESDTYYKYGGQDPLRAIGIDCSGLVVMCYTYALEGTGYNLLLPDMSAAYMHENASDVTYNPEPGDLVFMGDTNSSTINHIGIFTRKIGSEVYFIDSTSSGSINGVSERHYSEDNEKIKVIKPTVYNNC